MGISFYETRKCLNCASYKELKAFCKNVLRYSLNTTEKESSESKDKKL